MKPSRDQTSHTLINFRSPKYIHHSFDKICKLYSLNRSHVLNRLMIEYVLTETDKINNQIDVTNNFKNTTSKIEIKKSGYNHHKNQSQRNLKRENQSENWSDPFEFFYQGGNEI